MCRFYPGGISLCLMLSVFQVSATHVVGINLAHLNPECSGVIGEANTFTIHCPESHPGYQLQTQLTEYASIEKGGILSPVSVWVSPKEFQCQQDQLPPAPAQRLTSNQPIMIPQPASKSVWFFCVQSKQKTPEIEVDVVPLSDPSMDGVRIFDITFAHNDATLPVDMQQRLMSFLQFSGDLSQYRVELHGHASEVGEFQQNQHLSEARVSAVRAFLLMKAPWSVHDIQVGAFGESRPAYLVSSPKSDPREGWNRRVNLVLIPKKEW